ncbi:MAG TPA: Dabb family protein [Polyangiaceae bacterium]|nr:Dabb family protein [Polyangiaceae bacterium]
MVIHLVLFKFADPADAAEAQRRLLTLRGQIPGMSSLDAGLDFTRSARSFDLGLVTHHDSPEALQAYQVHPLHEEVAAFIRSKATGSAAADFES